MGNEASAAEREPDESKEGTMPNLFGFMGGEPKPAMVQARVTDIEGTSKKKSKNKKRTKTKKKASPGDMMELAGGYKTGDTVYSLISHKDGSSSIKPGSKGKVKGFSENPGAVAVTFGKRCELSMTISRISRVDPTKAGPDERAFERSESVELAGGFEIGDTVYSLVSHKDGSGSIEPGSKGTVTGSPGKSQAVAVEFESGCKLAMTISRISRSDPSEGDPEKYTFMRSESVELAGGYSIGDIVFSLVFHSDDSGSIEPGSKGTVTGASDNPKAVAVEFNSGCSLAMTISRISRVEPSSTGDPEKYTFMRSESVELAGGYSIGDIVFSLVSHSDASGSIEPGSKGTVTGASGNPKAVAVEFDSGCKLSMTISRITRKDAAE